MIKLIDTTEKSGREAVNRERHALYLGKFLGHFCVDNLKTNIDVIVIGVGILGNGFCGCAEAMLISKSTAKTFEWNRFLRYIMNTSFSPSSVLSRMSILSDFSGLMFDDLFIFTNQAVESQQIISKATPYILK